MVPPIAATGRPRRRGDTAAKPKPVARFGCLARPGTIVRSGAVVFVALALAGCLGYDGDIQHGYQLDAALVADVKPGQSAEQVLVTMGSPSTTSTVGGDAWYYIQQKTQRSIAFMKPEITDRHIFAVYFDKGKKVARIANYGLRDGQVVNFASGATATMGADNNFLKGLFFNFNPFGGLIQKS